MIKVVTIIGARPQIIKAAAISRCINSSFKKKIREIIVHTGQHYDENMSEVFFREMGIPKPHYNLNVGSSTHAKQTADMMIKTEEVLLKEKPDCVILYGDTNSTLAGSVTAAKMQIPVVHIEAGLRSFNKAMPEEINRIVCDHTSTLLFSPTLTGIKNLENEGFNNKARAHYTADNPGIFHCGDVMYDNAIHFAEKAEKSSSILKALHLEKDNYLLATIHRDYNTDNPVRLNGIVEAIHNVTKENKLSIVIPLHPRTSKILETTLEKKLMDAILKSPLIKIIQPVSFFDMIQLEKNSLMILTDSGGVQKEAFFYKKPCLILRSETEWVEIVEAGAAMVCDADTKKITKAFEFFRNKKINTTASIFGDGKASEFICKEIYKNFNKK
ncbi:MAG: UDP-N-acetylglucosamine 2-epimerase (non-hydrolyzing) [Bacteroidales bacterium]|jgi:UDP-GlcNAc3NAcA epimerase